MKSDLVHIMEDIISIIPKDRISELELFKFYLSSLEFSTPETEIHWWWGMMNAVFEKMGNPASTSLDWKKKISILLLKSSSLVNIVE